MASARRRVTSLSWDVRGNLWVASPDRVWMLPPPGTGKEKPVRWDSGCGPPARWSASCGSPPTGCGSRCWSTPRARTGTICCSRRSARPLAAPRLWVSPCPSAPTCATPTQLTWYDADHLIVLSRSQTVPQLWEVPVNGGSSTALLPDPGTQSITAAGPAQPDGRGPGARSAGPGIKPQRHVDARTPAPPGLRSTLAELRPPCPAAPDRLPRLQLLPQPPPAPRRLPAPSHVTERGRYLGLAAQVR